MTEISLIVTLNNQFTSPHEMKYYNLKFFKACISSFTGTCPNCMSNTCLCLFQIAYLVVTFPFIIILVLLVRALTLEGNMQGIKFYVTPKWEKLQEAGVWADAAVQVFFSLSACMGGLTTLSSYNKFHNNIYRCVLS